MGSLAPSSSGGRMKMGGKEAAAAVMLRKDWKDQKELKTKRKELQDLECTVD